MKNLYLPDGHAVPRAAHLQKVLLKSYELQPVDFAQFLGQEGVGPKTVRALALVAEVVHGARPSFQDPVRYSFAHGGKDGHPYPVDRLVYDQSIHVLKEAVNEAKVGHHDRMRALQKLANWEKEGLNNA